MLVKCRRFQSSKKGKGSATRLQYSMAKFMLRASKLGQPLKSIILDYVEVSRDLWIDFKTKPAKAIFVFTLGGVCTALVKKCPDYSSYKNEIIEYSNELGLCAEISRNRQTKLYVDKISAVINNCSVKHVNLGVCTVIMEKPCSCNCQNYHEVCKYILPRKWMFYRGIIDFGVWDHWFFLTKTMTDFDVNDEEFK